MAADLPAPRISNNTDRSFDVEWSRVEGVTSFVVEVARYDGNAPDFTSLLQSKSCGAGTTSVQCDGLAPASSYGVRIAATMADGSTRLSDPTVADTAVGSCGPKCVLL